jgi:hypothetical protein
MRDLVVLAPTQRQGPIHFSAALYFAVSGLILPVVCFVTAVNWGFDPDWQSGEVGDLAGLLMAWRSAGFFYPHLLYSMFCLALTLARFDYGRNVWVRVGLSSGVLLSLQYEVILCLIDRYCRRCSFPRCSFLFSLFPILSLASSRGISC